MPRGQALALVMPPCIRELAFDLGSTSIPASCGQCGWLGGSKGEQVGYFHPYGRPTFHALLWGVKQLFLSLSKQSKKKRTQGSPLLSTGRPLGTRLGGSCPRDYRTCPGVDSTSLALS